MNRIKPQLLILILLSAPVFGLSQMITGTWKGKINQQKVELKIIQQGDSLYGSSYYYESATNYRRYAIKGYFDAETNEAVWWDDYLVEETGRAAAGKIPLVSRADFNCPGGAKMMLDGKASPKQGPSSRTGTVDLDKTDNYLFSDEWDYVIENYTAGANDPEVIDSIAALSQPDKEQIPVATAAPVPPEIRVMPPSVVINNTSPPANQTIEEKFQSRNKVLVREIPLRGDSIELRFYDNAEIDGDSISLFLNNKLLFQHIRLQGSAYTIRLAVSELNVTNELIMVAENLGSIPPNTSYMVALVGEKRYEARLESTEGSSAMIRFVKKLE